MNRHRRHVNDQGARRRTSPHSRAFLFGWSTLPATHLRKSRLRTPPLSPRARTGHAPGNVTARASLRAAWPLPPYRDSLNCACNQQHKSPPLDPYAASVALPASPRPPPLDQCPSSQCTQLRIAPVAPTAVVHVTPALIGTSGPFPPACVAFVLAAAMFLCDPHCGVVPWRAGVAEPGGIAGCDRLTRFDVLAVCGRIAAGSSVDEAIYLVLGCMGWCLACSCPGGISGCWVLSLTTSSVRLVS